MPSVVGQITKGAVFDKLVDAVHVAGTAHRLLYTGADGVVNELAYGTPGQHLKAEGASSAPTWETPSAGSVDTSGTPVALDYARFTDADTIEGRSYAEVLSDIGAAAVSHHDTHDPEDGADALDTAAPVELVGVQASGVGSSHSFARSDHSHQISYSITNLHLVCIDHAAVADDDYAKFTANGLEGRSYAEVLSDIGAAAVAHESAHMPGGGDVLQIASYRFLGRRTAATGDVEELTPADGRAVLNVADGANAYSHPNHSGDVTSVADGAQTIVADAVTYNKMRDTSSTDVLLGRETAGGGTVEEIACTAAGRALIDDADASAQRTTMGAAAASHSHDLSDDINLAVTAPIVLTDDTLSLATITTAHVEDELKSHDRIEYIKSPTDSDDYPFFYTKKAITITEVRGVTDVGTLTFQLKWRPWATMFTAAGTNILSASMVADVTGETTTSFADATIPAGSVIAYVASAESTAPVELAILLTFTVD